MALQGVPRDEELRVRSSFDPDGHRQRRRHLVRQRRGDDRRPDREQHHAALDLFPGTEVQRPDRRPRVHRTRGVLLRTWQCFRHRRRETGGFFLRLRDAEGARVDGRGDRKSRHLHPQGRQRFHRRHPSAHRRTRQPGAARSRGSGRGRRQGRFQAHLGTPHLPDHRQLHPQAQQLRRTFRGVQRSGRPDRRRDSGLGAGRQRPARLRSDLEVPHGPPLQPPGSSEAGALRAQHAFERLQQLRRLADSLHRRQSRRGSDAC